MNVFNFLLLQVSACSADLIGFNRLGNNLHSVKINRGYNRGASVDDVIFQIFSGIPEDYLALLTRKVNKRRRQKKTGKNHPKFKTYIKNMRL